MLLNYVLLLCVLFLRKGICLTIVCFVSQERSRLTMPMCFVSGKVRLSICLSFSQERSPSVTIVCLYFSRNLFSSLLFISNSVCISSIVLSLIPSIK